MDCLFCKMMNKEIPASILYEDEFVMAFLDINQKQLGHTLIIPKKHIESIMEADDKILTHMFEIGKKISTEIMEKLNQTGMSYCINYGDCQEMKHLHLHLGPYSKTKKKEMTKEEVYEILTK